MDGRELAAFTIQALLVTGRIGVMENVAGAELVPSELITATDALPAAAIKLAGTTAESWAAPATAVGSAEPFHAMLAPEEKPEPFTVKVKLGPPAVADAGDNDVITGVTVAAALMVKSCEREDVPAAMSETITDTDPTDDRAVAGSCAASVVELMKVVGRANWVPLALTRSASL